MAIKTEVTFSFDQDDVIEIVREHLKTKHGVDVSKDEIVVKIDDSYNDTNRWGVHPAKIRSISAKVDISRVKIS